MKKKVLVFPCGTEIGLEIHRSLRYSNHFDLIGASSEDDHGSVVYENYVSGVPYIDDPTFLDAINTLVSERGVDYIFPAHDSVVTFLSEAFSNGNLKCDVVTSPAETCRVARSKRLTYEILSEVIRVPHEYTQDELEDDNNYPVFLKPEIGQGSKGTYLAKNFDEYSFFFKRDNTLMALEYLPGEEFTVDCFTDKDGVLRYSSGRCRQRVSNGISVKSTTVADKQFRTIAEKINNTLKFRGVWFFQLKRDSKGFFVLLEIAPRVAGTMGLSRVRGVNLPLLALYDMVGIDVVVDEITDFAVVDRALVSVYKHNLQYKSVYLDFDDLTVIDGRINIKLIAFIYQLKNKGIKSYLITRHREDIRMSLEKYSLAGVFDDIILVQDQEPKSKYITDDLPIFIDDSFAERMEVSNALGIPVFDAMSLDLLMEDY